MNMAQHLAIPKSGKMVLGSCVHWCFNKWWQAIMMGIMDIDTQTVGQSGNHINNTTGEYVAYLLTQ